MTSATPTLYGYTCEDYWTYLHYEPVTGLFTWKERAGNASFNTRFSGKRALEVQDSKGYLKGMLLCRNVWAHRVAYFMYHNMCIPQDIDHVNGVRTDNRILNLRSVTVAENRKNSAIRSDNTSGVTGVSWMASKNRWRARFYTTDGVEHHIGLFHCKEEAARALRACRAAHGYHENHGRQPRAKS